MKEIADFEGLTSNPTADNDFIWSHFESPLMKIVILFFTTLLVKTWSTPLNDDHNNKSHLEDSFENWQCEYDPLTSLKDPFQSIKLQKLKLHDIFKEVRDILHNLTLSDDSDLALLHYIAAPENEGVFLQVSHKILNKYVPELIISINDAKNVNLLKKFLGSRLPDVKKIVD